MYVLLLFAVKLLDPLTAIMALIAGALSRTWWHAGFGALVVATLVEMILSQLQPGRSFEAGEFAVGILAAFAWVALAFYIKRRAAAKRAGQPPSRPN